MTATSPAQPARSTRGLQAAIVNDAAEVIGTFDCELPETTEAARVALLPIANFRAAAAERAQRANRGNPARMRAKRRARLS